MGFFSEIMEFFKLAVMGGFVLVIVFMLLIALPRSPFRDFVMQGLLWSIVLISGFLVLSPADFIPLLPFDDLIAGGSGLSAAAMAVAQKIRHAREDKERAKTAGLQPVRPANVNNTEAA